MKILIAGSRNFTNYALLKSEMEKILELYKITPDNPPEIIEGGAKGADALASIWAKEKGFPVKEFPADWDTDGKSAGYKRNERMHKYIAESPERVCVLFWDGVSKGTAHNLLLVDKYNTTVCVFNTSLNRWLSASETKIEIMNRIQEQQAFRKNINLNAPV